MKGWEGKISWIECIMWRFIVLGVLVLIGMFVLKLLWFASSSPFSGFFFSLYRYFKMLLPWQDISISLLYRLRNRVFNRQPHLLLIGSD